MPNNNALLDWKISFVRGTSASTTAAKNALDADSGEILIRVVGLGVIN